MLLLSWDTHLAKLGFQVKQLPGSISLWLSKELKSWMMILWAAEHLLQSTEKTQSYFKLLRIDCVVCFNFVLEHCEVECWSWNCFEGVGEAEVRLPATEERVLPAFYPPALFSVSGLEEWPLPTWQQLLSPRKTNAGNWKSSLPHMAQKMRAL